VAREWKPWGDEPPHNGRTDPIYGQRLIWDRRAWLWEPKYPADTLFAACGPRWGKDRLCTWVTLDGLLRLFARRMEKRSRLNPLVHAWVSAPSSEDYEQVWREFLENSKGLPRVVYRASGQERLILFGESPTDRKSIQIEFKSAWHPERLQGVGLDLDYRTEWALFGDEANANLEDRAASPGRCGVRVINGYPTERPSVRYRKLFERAVAGDPSILFVNAPSWENPLLGEAQMERLCKVMEQSSERRRRAFQGAQLLPVGSGIKGYSECATAFPEKGANGGYYLKIWDPAGEGADRNALSVFRFDGAYRHEPLQVALYVWDYMEWRDEKRHLASIDADYPGEFHFDANGRRNLRGQLEELLPSRVIPHTWTRPVKADMVDSMVRMIGDRSVTLLHPDANEAAKLQRSEVDGFDLDKLNGTPHDDTVTPLFILADLMYGGSRLVSAADAFDSLGIGA